MAAGDNGRSSTPAPTRRTELAGRAFDIALGVLLLALAAPVIVAAAVGSAISLRAWPFFSHERVGRNGETFRFIKIRTLPASVSAYTDKFQLNPRQIPAFCGLLRATHIDELPQLVLVVLGRMSLVGPRPEMRHLHERMPAPFASLRTAVRPGCTGLWQVSESSTGLISSAPEYDHFYLSRRTVRLDAWILYRTAVKVLRPTSRITLDTIPAWALASAPDDIIDLRHVRTASEAMGESPSLAVPTAGR